MPQKTKERIWFQRYRTPLDFFRASDSGLHNFFIVDQPPPQYLREAYVAGLFACIWKDSRGPCRVRLVSEKDQFPDAQLETKGEILQLEVRMALKANSKIFKEWQELRAIYENGGIVPAQSSEERQATAREAIPRAVREKAEKHYAIPPTLLVYSDDARSISAEEMTILAEPWKEAFQAIYILSGMDAVLTWARREILRAKQPPWSLPRV